MLTTLQSTHYRFVKMLLNFLFLLNCNVIFFVFFCIKTAALFFKLFHKIAIIQIGIHRNGKLECGAKRIVVLKFHQFGSFGLFSFSSSSFLISLCFCSWVMFCLGVITIINNEPNVWMFVCISSGSDSYLKVSLDLKDVACTEYVDGVIKLYSA